MAIGRRRKEISLDPDMRMVKLKTQAGSCVEDSAWQDEFLPAARNSLLESTNEPFKLGYKF